MSDQDTSIFTQADQAKPQNTVVNSPASPQQDDSLLEVFVGEGRKYKSTAEFVKGVIHLDEHRERLEAENRELREKLAAAATVDSVLERLNDKTTSTTEDRSGEAIGPADIASIVEQTITGRETALTRRNNLLKADELMKSTFGDKAVEVFNREASTPELREALQNLAAVDPHKFVALFSPSKQQGSQVDSNVSINTTSLNTNNLSGRVADPGCQEYYTELRRKDPTKYYSRDVQLAMDKAAQADPAKWFGR
jgi:Arc/MetJ-type ribon-helix-helix transcriptional regulator